MRSIPITCPLLRRAYDKWHALEEECGESLLTITGILEAGHSGSEVVRGSLLSSREHGLDYELIDAAEVARRFPAFRLPPDWTALYQPQGGFLRPERAVIQFVDQARRRGAEVWIGTQVLAIRPEPGAVMVDTTRGPVEAGRVIVSTGAWIGALAPERWPRG